MDKNLDINVRLAVVNALKISDTTELQRVVDWILEPAKAQIIPVTQGVKIIQNG